MLGRGLKFMRMFVKSVWQGVLVATLMLQHMCCTVNLFL